MRYSVKNMHFTDTTMEQVEKANLEGGFDVKHMRVDDHGKDQFVTVGRLRRWVCTHTDDKGKRSEVASWCVRAYLPNVAHIDHEGSTEHWVSVGDDFASYKDALKALENALNVMST